MNDKLIIGIIVKPQGIKGEVKVKPLTDFAEELQNYKEVYVDGERQKILNIKVVGNEVYYVIRGIADRNAAELLRGKLIEIDRNEAIPLEEGKYYVVDVIGSKVFTDTGKEIGVVKDITTISTDIYTVTNAKGEIRFPLVKDLLINMDIKNKVMTISEKRFNEVAVYED
jgi:16S rRNA processing protein RimM